MGRANYFSSFKENADGFICSTLPGIPHPQVQFSPGIPSLFSTLSFFVVEKSDS